MKLIYYPIGTIHSPFTNLTGMPIQPTGESSASGTVEIFPEYSEGLKDLADFSHIILIYHLHKVACQTLIVKPFLGDQTHGVFATRAPTRPNPIGLSVVKLDRIEGYILYVENLDILDGTPLLDIKPYIPEFDRPVDFRIGWLQDVVDQVKTTRSDDRFT
jgi:tRNA-Thr(GGU) m(6)t(6)A37 methyltransferase TsaA